MNKIDMRTEAEVCSFMKIGGTYVRFKEKEADVEDVRVHKRVVIGRSQVSAVRWVILWEEAAESTFAKLYHSPTVT